MHLAALGAHEDAVEALLDCGAPAEAWLAARELNAGGSLPLHCAVKVGAVAQLQGILCVGAAPRVGFGGETVQRAASRPMPAHWHMGRLRVTPRRPLPSLPQSGVPMVAYQLASKQPAACLEPDGKQRTPIQLAVAADKGEVRAPRSCCSGCNQHSTSGPRNASLPFQPPWSGVPTCCTPPMERLQCSVTHPSAVATLQVLNAMLLACAGHATATSLAATRKLLAAGAVPDTWAPSGSSSLMLAASVDCAEGVALLLDHGASLELQDALGR